MSGAKFITIEELDKKLEMFEKRGGGETAANAMESSIKKFVRSQAELTHQEMTKQFEERATQILEKLDHQTKRHVEIALSKAEESMKASLDSSVQKARRDISEEVVGIVKNKTHEIRSSLVESQKAFEASLEKLFLSKISAFESKSQAETLQFENALMEKLQVVAKDSILSVKEEVLAQTKQNVAETLLKVSQVVEGLRSELAIEMSKKLVDKQAIEQKMRDIEFELQSKAKSVIDFNISQARANMEQAAKAEVEEGIKIAAGKIMSGLGG